MRRFGKRRIRAATLLVVALALALVLSPASSPAKKQGGQEKGAQEKGGKKHSPKKGGHKQAPSGPVGGSKKGPSAALSRQGIVESGAWRNYVRDSSSPYVYPASVEVRGTSPGNTIGDPGGLAAPDTAAATLTATGPDGPYEVIDLGRLSGGQVQIGVSSANVGIRLAYSEAKRFLGPGGDIDHGSQGRNDDPSARSDIVPGGPGNVTLAGVRGAQRYIRVQLAGAGTAQIDYIRVVTTHLRPTVDDYLGHFLSSDQLLNRIWYAGAYTLNVDSYGDPARGNRFAVTDGAKHDRLVWLGDIPIEAMAGYYTVRQMPDLLRRSMQLFTCQQYKGGFIPQVSEVNVDCPTPGPANGPPGSAKGICTCVTGQRLPSYTAWFVVGAAQAYRMTGDPRIADWLPVVRRAVRYFEKGLGPRGLFVTQQGELNWHPPDLAAGEDADTNSVWVRALQGASTLEKQLGDPRQGRRYAAMARRLSDAIRAALFDPSVGALRLNTADPTGNHTQDANVQGILSGVLRGTTANAAFSWLGGTLATPFGTATGQFGSDPFMGRYISPFESGWEVIARLRYYQTTQALGLIRRLWGQMVASDPGDTVWEKMTLDGGVAPYQGANPDGSPIVENSLSGETSLAHGWGSGPTAALSAYVLGLRPVAPGWKTWLVEPQPGDLSFAQGSVGTPVGKLGVRWEHPNGKSFRITVKAHAARPAPSRYRCSGPIARLRATVASSGRAATRSAARRRDPPVATFASSSPRPAPTPTLGPRVRLAAWDGSTR